MQPITKKSITPQTTALGPPQELAPKFSTAAKSKAGNEKASEPMRYVVDPRAVEIPDGASEAGWKAGGFGGELEDGVKMGRGIPTSNGVALTDGPVDIFRLPLYHVPPDAILPALVTAPSVAPTDPETETQTTPSD